MKGPPLLSVIVPFRFGDPDRDRAWTFVRRRYLDLLHAEIVVGAYPQRGAWSKGLAVSRAVSRARSDLFLITDADVYVSQRAIEETVEAVLSGAAWGQPHGYVYRLSRAMSGSVVSGMIDQEPRVLPGRMLERRAHPGPHGGGMVVCTRDAYEASGGIDPRFTGWGGEDISFARALDTLAGPCARGQAIMWHLWHERMPRRPGNRASEENERLAARYLIASGNPDAMRRLRDEHRALVSA